MQGEVSEPKIDAMTPKRDNTIVPDGGCERAREHSAFSP